MHQRISRRSALISGGAALFLSVTGQFSEHSPALDEQTLLVLWEREWQGLFLTEVPLSWLTTSRSTLE